MKWLPVVAIFIFSPFAFASQYDFQGPPGPQGPKGDPGIPGKNGLPGIPGNSASIENRLEARIGANVQWYDMKHFNFNSGYRYDVNHGGHTVDFFTLGIKLGKSYESKQVDALRKELTGLKERLSKRDSKAVDIFIKQGD